MFFLVVQILKSRLYNLECFFFPPWEFYKRTESYFITVPSLKPPVWRGICASETVFSQYRISSILVANIGMRLVTLIWEEFVFFGAGSDTFWPSKRFRKTFQLTFSPWIPLWVHLKSFKNIKMLFFNAHPAKSCNVELAGFINTFGKRVDTGLRKMFFHNQLDHATLCLDVLSTLFWRGL